MKTTYFLPTLLFSALCAILPAPAHIKSFYKDSSGAIHAQTDTSNIDLYRSMSGFYYGNVTKRYYQDTPPLESHKLQSIQDTLSRMEYRSKRDTEDRFYGL